MYTGSPERQTHGVLHGVPILVVEDDPASARLVATVLSTEGANDVRIAHSAEEALAVARNGRIRVLIVDIVLPGISGLMLVQRLKSERSTRQVIAVAVSGWDGDDAEGEAVESGCIALLRKPFDSRELLSVLAAALE